ncbi:hypothetical protein [Candidatus Mycoplasma haematominutum]|uniref:Uncharacterized protein n=1 Tax=Candidatus Mycoplasma haematominutum 'Birmingham 1' TaxID=1116213 RepID=G8C379_9MOLU|nr:hypothetical protein [Candidatus Mycoplasma haematominutum]CCE66777.1 hypothetical protein (homolog to MSU_0488) [Candidatus Mycoplasma haematominutum 'Birmingham 1']
MSREGDKPPLSFLEGEKLREILKKGSEVLLINAEAHLIEKAAKLIESMKEDLIKVMNMPLKNVDVFHSRETLTLQEIEDFYSNWEKETKRSSKLSR